MGDDSPALNQLWTGAARAKALRQEPERHAHASRYLTQAVVEALQVKPGGRVLDLACGPGDPTLEIAQVVGPTGSVVGADISEDALEIGRERARGRGLSHVEFRRADVNALPFSDADFDALSCRFGAMFFGDLSTACKEMHRVLRPGAHAVFMVWGPADQPNFNLTMGVLANRLGLSGIPAPYDTPFRFAAPHELEGALEAAEFRSVEARTRTIDWVWDGSPEELARSWMETVVFWRPFLDRIPQADHGAVEREIADNFRKHWRDGAIRMPDVVRVVTARR